MAEAWRIATALLIALALAACSAEENGAWLGYTEGEEAFVAPPQPGWLTTLDVSRGDEIALGDTLFTLDATREIAARDNARAAIEAARALRAQGEAQAAGAVAARRQAEAETTRASAEFERQQGLVDIGASPRRELEAATATLESARARRTEADARRAQAVAAQAQAEAQIAEAEALLMSVEFNLSERTVKARIAGRIEDIYFRAGEYATGAPVLSILPPENVFIRFFVPEEAVAMLQLGDEVRIGCDGCPENLIASVSFIASEVEFSPPVIYSVANRQKLVFKAEARIEGGLNLRPGLPVDVTPVE